MSTDINEVVKKIIIAQDPLHLIAIGAPEDEYNLEIGKVTYRIQNKNKGEKIIDILKEVFTETFDEDTMQKCIVKLEIIANQIEESLRD